MIKQKVRQGPLRQLDGQPSEVVPSIKIGGWRVVRKGRQLAGGAAPGELVAMAYSFPILSNQEILACLKELDVELQEQDLLKPSHDTLRAAYESMVILLVGVTREEMYTPDVEAGKLRHKPGLTALDRGANIFMYGVVKVRACVGVQLPANHSL